MKNGIRRGNSQCKITGDLSKYAFKKISIENYEFTSVSIPLTFQEIQTKAQQKILLLSKEQMGQEKALYSIP